MANVGDSRCYLLRQGELIQVTEDHTAVAVLLQQGLLSPEEAAHHPDRHAITRAIGVEPEVQPDYTVIDLLRGDALLTDCIIPCRPGSWPAPCRRFCRVGISIH